MDQADVAEIVRHLVDEERRVLPVQPRILDELRAKGSELVAAELVQDFGIA